MRENAEIWLLLLAFENKRCLFTKHGFTDKLMSVYDDAVRDKRQDIFMGEKGHRIKEILPDSIAEEFELEPGDILLKINENEIEDVFDYQYFVEDEYIEVLIRKADGEELLLEIDKDPDEDLGIVFEKSLMGDYKSCCNKCMFCFIDQMPKGMRQTLYFKDDDARLSFLQGNYITLTNMKDRDIDRIIRYHLGPINISVHTTNPTLRCKMLKNRFAGEALKKIDRLFEGGIGMNGQIVLCKGVNDGEELNRTIRDLAAYLPVMRSVSVVPAGLTKYREGLYPLESFEKEDAVRVIDQIESFQEDFYRRYGLHFIHASDEWYIMAGRDFPEEERYDGYLQLENGVGMMRLLWNEFSEAYEALEPDQVNWQASGEKNATVRMAGGKALVREISIATGVLAFEMISRMAGMLEQKLPGLTIHCYRIINDFFGEKITVSGLITGTDLIHQLKGKELGECLLLPNNILRSGEDVFLDDYTLKEVSEAIGTKIVITPTDGKGFIDAVTGCYNQESRQPNGGFVYIDAYQ